MSNSNILPIFDNKYNILNDSDFGGVVLCQNIISKEKVIIKLLFENHKSYQKDEIEKILKLNNPFVLKYLESYFSNICSAIVMEYFENGDLDRQIKIKEDLNSKFEPDLIFLWVHEMIQGVDFLKSKEIVHCNIEPKNVFVTDTHIKLGDYSNEYINGNKISIHSNIYKYLSPEIRNNRKYCYKADIWSIGCIIFELITLEKYFGNEKFFYMESTTEDLNELLKQFKQMLHENPKKRKSSHELLKTIESMKSYKMIYSKIYCNKGVKLKILNKNKKALYWLDKSIDLDSNNLEAIICKGNCLNELKKYHDAIIFYNKALELNPNNPLVYYNKGTTLVELKKSINAIECFNKAIEIEPDNPCAFNAIVNKGIALNDLKKHTDAIVYYDEALEINPYCVYAYMNKGNSLADLKRFEDAIACYNRAIQLEPNFNSFYNKGNCLCDLKRYKEAIKCFDKAIIIDPKNTLVLYNKGIILNELKKFNKAILCFEKALEINPNYTDAIDGKANSLKNLKKYEDAILFYDRSIELDAKNSFAYYNKGYCLYETKRFKEADICFKILKELSPESFDDYNHLVLNIDKPKAKNWLKKIHFTRK